MDGLQIWEKVRAVPGLAIKPITGGRLKGMSDINPIWRLKVLTEQFGPCGIGWRYEITDKRLEKGANEEIAAFVDINLYIKVGEVWSEAIPGTGGSSFVAKERNGLYTSDECFKMALTDAISVACKALGVGADVYWEADKTKYNKDQGQGQSPPAEKAEPAELAPGRVQRLQILRKQKGITDEQHKKALDFYKVTSSKYLTEENYKHYIKHLESLLDAKMEGSPA